MAFVTNYVPICIMKISKLRRTPYRPACILAKPWKLERCENRKY